MIWGMTLHPGVEYSRVVTKEEHLTLASLDCRPKMNTEVYHPLAHLVVKVNNCEHALCYLEKGILHQQILDFILEEGDNIVLSVEGTGIVHISGYFVSHSKHEDIHQDGSMISAVNAVLDEVLHMDPTISIQNQPETNDSNSTLQERRLQGNKRLSERHFQQPGLEKETNEESAQSEKDHSLYQDEQCVEKGGPAIFENSDEATHFRHKSAESSHCFQTLTNSTVCLENSSSQETSVQVTEDRGNEDESNQGMKISRADTDDTPHSDLCSENHDTSAGGNKKENDSNISIGRLQKSGVKTIRKTPDFLMRCETVKEQSHSTFTVRVPANRKQPQQRNTSESAASESNNIENEETCINRSQFKCTLCEKTFQRRVSLMNHRKMHMVLKMQRCKACGRFVSQKDALDKEETTRHNYFQCQSCKNKSVDQSEKQSRRKSGPSRKEFKCHLCKRKFSSMRCLSNHKLTHNDENRFLCFVCGKVFAIKQSLHIHERIHNSNGPFECQFCGKRFVQKIQMILHESKHQIKKKPLQPYSSQKNIVKKNVSQQKGVRPFQCHYCGKRFISKSHVLQHVRIHTGERPFKCQFCAKAFVQKSHRTQHEKIHTGKKSYKCQFCDKKFISKAYVTNHENRSHPVESPLKCQFCSNRFTTKSQLTQHERIHIHEKKSECSFYNQSFRPNNQRSTQEKNYTKKKPFKCSFCPKRYTQKSHKTFHEKSHTNEKPFKCKICEKRFALKSHVVRHEKTHPPILVKENLDVSSV